MAVEPSFVQVAPDSTGKKIDNVEVTTAEGLVQRQVTVTADPENPDARGAVKNAIPAATDYGVVTREAPPGKDSGFVQMPIGGLSPVPNLSSGDVKVRHIFINNPAAATAMITVSDITNGRAYIGPDFPLQGRSFISVPMGGVLAVGGLQWTSKNQFTNGQILGD